MMIVKPVVPNRFGGGVVIARLYVWLLRCLYHMQLVYAWWQNVDLLGRVSSKGVLLRVAYSPSLPI